MSNFESLWGSLLKIVDQHKELEVTLPPYKKDEEEAFFLFMGVIEKLGAKKLIQDALKRHGFDSSLLSATLNLSALESYLGKTNQTAETVAKQFWDICKPYHNEILADVMLHKTKIGLQGGSKRKQRSRTNKRRNRTKRLYKKRRNTKRRNTKRKNTKRRNTKKRNTKRRV